VCFLVFWKKVWGQSGAKYKHKLSDTKVKKEKDRKVIAQNN